MVEHRFEEPRVARSELAPGTKFRGTMPNQYTPHPDDAPHRLYQLGDRVRPTLEFFRTLGKGGRPRAVREDSLGTVIAFGRTRHAYKVKWDSAAMPQMLHQKYITRVDQNDRGNGSSDS